MAFKNVLLVLVYLWIALVIKCNGQDSQETLGFTHSLSSFKWVNTTVVNVDFTNHPECKLAFRLSPTVFSEGTDSDEPIKACLYHRRGGFGTSSAQIARYDYFHGFDKSFKTTLQSHPGTFSGVLLRQNDSSLYGYILGSQFYGIVNRSSVVYRIEPGYKLRSLVKEISSETNNLESGLMFQDKDLTPLNKRRKRQIDSDGNFVDYNNYNNNDNINYDTNIDDSPQSVDASQQQQDYIQIGNANNNVDVYDTNQSADDAIPVENVDNLADNGKNNQDDPPPVETAIQIEQQPNSENDAQVPQNAVEDDSFRQTSQTTPTATESSTLSTTTTTTTTPTTTTTSTTTTEQPTKVQNAGQVTINSFGKIQNFHCQVILIADQSFYIRMGRIARIQTIGRMLYYMEKVDQAVRKRDWNGDNKSEDLSLELSRIHIENNWKSFINESIQHITPVSTSYKAMFSRLPKVSKACIVIAFTATPLTKESDSINATLCTGNNTILISTVDKFGRELLDKDIETSLENAVFEALGTNPMNTNCLLPNLNMISKGNVASTLESCTDSKVEQCDCGYDPKCVTTQKTCCSRKSTMLECNSTHSVCSGRKCHLSTVCFNLGFHDNTAIKTQNIFSTASRPVSGIAITTVLLLYFLYYLILYKNDS